MSSAVTPGILEVRAPAAADVQDELVRVHLSVVVEDAALVLLRLLERLLTGEIAGRGVVHALVQPEAEELVRNAV
jgi:hypothetical protein